MDLYQQNTKTTLKEKYSRKLAQKAHFIISEAGQQTTISILGVYVHDRSGICQCLALGKSSR